MVIHSTQLKKPISFPFKPAQAPTTECILSEVQRVVQSNQHFRLNDTVDVNVIHVSMPSGGKGRKRTDVSLEKHLEKKRAVVRIQNKVDLCMARALVVAKAKVDDDPQYKSIVKHQRPMQTRLAQELHATPTFLWVRVVSKKPNGFKCTSPSIKLTLYRKSTTTRLFTAVRTKTRGFICTCTTITTT